MNDLLDPEALLNMMEDLEDERKKVEESEEKYRLLFENTSDCIMVFDAKTKKFEYANKATLDLLGYTLEEFCNLTVADISDEKEKTEVSVKNIAKGDKSRIAERRFVKKDGKTFIGEITPGKFVDSKGEIKIIGAVRDITERKKAEKEKEKLQNRLRKYAKRLEIKLKKLEGDRANLTDKEKLVLWGITRYPHSNDLKLSKRLKIKRSTITAIRNRLREKQMYAVEMVPDYSKLGAELVTFAYGRHNMLYEAKTEIRNKIFEAVDPNYFLTTDNEFMGVYTSQSMIEFERKISPYIDMIYKQNVVKKMALTHFFYGLSSMMRFMEYAPLLKDLFKIKNPEKEPKEEEEIKVKLSNNDKKVLLKMIEYPELSSYDLSFKVDLTRATVAKIKKKLIKNKIVKKIIVPNTVKLGLGLMMITHIRHGPGVNDEEFKRMLNANSHIIFMIKGDKESIGISLFKGYTSYKKLKSNMPTHNTDILAEEPIMFKILTKNIKNMRIDFLNPTKRLLS